VLSRIFADGVRQIIEALRIAPNAALGTERSGVSRRVPYIERIGAACAGAAQASLS